MAKKLIVEVVGDSKSYERALKKSATATQQFGQAMGTTAPQMSKLSKGMALTGTSSVFLAGAAGGLAVALGAKSVSAASDLNEEITKSQQVFGDSAKEIKSWSETTATAMGISQTEALRATGTFGALFKTLDVGEKQNADLSKSLVKLASDMSSFNNANPEDVLLALRSGLTGEAEPLRRFGVFLSEARTQQLALNQTGKTSIKTLTNQEKVLARYSIIMRDTASAQGDFERTSGGLANQQRILRAQVTNLEASMGKALIPTVTALVGALNDTITAGNQVVGVLGKIGDIPGIDIPINFVFGGGRGAEFFQDFVLGHISPVALGFKIGKQLVQGTQDGIDDGTVLDFSKIMPGELPGLPPLPGVVPILPPVAPPKGPKGPFEELEARRRAQAQAFAAQRAIERATNRANASNNQLLRESETRAAHIRELIRADPNNVKLGKRLTDELEKQAQLHKDIATASADAARTAKDAAKTAHEASVQAAKDRKEREKDQADRRREATKRQQFKDLGLTGEGLKPTPGSGALLQRALGLEGRVKGTVLERTKTGAQLKKIVEFLKKNFNKAGKDVREAILGMLNDISGAFKEGDKAITGPLTKTHGLDTSELVKNLGLTSEQQRDLRGRLSKFNTAGRALGGTSSTATLPRRGFGEIPVVESHVTINLDGQKVANVVTRNQQKTRRRNPQQKRGPNRR